MREERASSNRDNLQATTRGQRTVVAESLQPGEEEAAALDAPSAAPMDLERFCQWFADNAPLSCTPDPAAQLYRDLGLDQFRLLSVVTQLDHLLLGRGTVEADIYENIETVRDLYLYYLYRFQAPPGTD